MYEINRRNKTVTIETVNKLVTITESDYNEPIEEKVAFSFDKLVWVNHSVGRLHNNKYGVFLIEVGDYEEGFTLYSINGEIEFIKQMYTDFSKIKGGQND